MPDARDSEAARRLLALALAPPEPMTFGDYELLERIGEGATSEVRRARRIADGKEVALKLMRVGYPAGERGRFLEGPRAASALDHPNIARVIDYGEQDGTPFVAMTLVHGQPLSVMKGLTVSEAVRLVAAVARVVQHAHERGIVHHDIKPENILVDDAGKPWLIDFGSARRLNARLTANPGVTLAYVAPEGLEAEGGATSPSVDIYALGVTLYQLLTGQLPLRADSMATFLHRLVREEPLSPRALVTDVSRPLELVCLKSLEKAPARRFRSAGAFADELDRIGRGVPIETRPPSLPRRARQWARRRPRVATALAAAMIAVVVAAAAVLTLWQARAREEARTLETNAFIANAQAGLLLYQLRDYGDRLERAAREPAVVELLRRGRVVQHAPEIDAIAAGFTCGACKVAPTVWVLALDGRLLAQGPFVTPRILGARYDFRDYFRGARALAAGSRAGVYLARVQRSESRNALEFPLSTPVRDAAGALIGVLTVSFSAQDAVGAVQMQAPDGRRITTALLGPRGPDRHDAVLAIDDRDFTFVVHPGLGAGKEHALTSPGPRQIRATFGSPGQPGQQFELRHARPLKVAGFRDPIAGYEGEWLAAFAPVGNTGYVVLVETPREPLLP